MMKMKGMESGSRLSRGVPVKSRRVEQEDGISLSFMSSAPLLIVSFEQI
jgi:hypothetical protein